MFFGETIAGYSARQRERKYNLRVKFTSVNKEHSRTEQKPETVNRKHFSTKMRKWEVK
jgi:hypothetical protein